jgi:hypothetical protein
MNRRMKGLSLGSKLLVALVVIATTGLYSVEASSKVLAQCNPGRTNNGTDYHVGAIADGYQPGGIYSTILTYSPYVYSGSNNTAWVMLDNPTNDNNGNSGSNWAQIGWEAVSSSVVYTFVQFTTHAWVPADGTTYVTTWLNNNTQIYQGANYTYTVLYNNTAGDFTFQVNGSDWTSPSKSPFSFTPDEAQTEGEIHTFASQMAGGNSYPEDFQNTYWWLPSPASNWETYYSGTYSTAAENDSNSAFNYANINSTESQISDSACSS